MYMKQNNEKNDIYVLFSRKKITYGLCAMSDHSGDNSLPNQLPAGWLARLTIFAKPLPVLKSSMYVVFARPLIKNAWIRE